MRVVISTFQGVNAKQRLGMTRLLIPIAEIISQYTPITFYMGEYDGSLAKLAHIKFMKIFPAYSYLMRIIFFVLTRQRLIKNGRGHARFIQEYLYDWLLSYKVDGCFLISAAYTPRAFKKNLKLGGYNIFLAGNPHDGEINAIMKREMLKHGVTIYDPYVHRARLDMIEETYNLASKIIYHTQSQHETFSSRIPQGKLFYSEAIIQPSSNYTPVSEKLITRSASENIVCSYIAHTVWLKGLTYLLTAWDNLSYSGITLRIGGHISHDVQKFIEKSGYRLDGVIFYGAVHNAAEFIRDSDVCIVPSLIDAGPATVAESLCCGIPVICTTGCGSKTLIDDSNGIIVPQGDAIALADAITSIVNNIDKYRNTKNEISEKIRSRNENSLYDVFSTYILDLYKEIN